VQDGFWIPGSRSPFQPCIQSKLVTCLRPMIICDTSNQPIKNHYQMSKLIVLLAVLLLLGSMYAETIEEIEEFDAAVEEANAEGAKPQNIDFSGSCLKAYGSYCGPGWCSGKWWGTCGNGGNPSIQTCPTTSGSKDSLDECCRLHDKCCISSRNPNPALTAPACDQAIITCIKAKAKCPWYNLDCDLAKEAILLFFENRNKNVGC
jgi:hypothetical protein